MTKEYQVFVDVDGTIRWHVNGKLHREDGPAYQGITEEWYFEGLRHREGGPAIVYPNGSKYYYRHGALHRETGPACENHDGSKNWYLEGKLLTEEEFVLKQGEIIEVDGKKYRLIT